MKCDRKPLFSALRNFWSLVLLTLLPASLLFATGCLSGAQGVTPEEQMVGKLISAYFSSWSKPDMEAYRRCFHPQASVYFIDASGNPHRYQLDTFISAQEKAHRLAAAPMVEKPTHSSIDMRGRVARALVRWQLDKGKDSITGTDFFTFIKTDLGWKILSLVYEQDKK